MAVRDRVIRGLRLATVQVLALMSSMRAVDAGMRVARSFSCSSGACGMLRVTGDLDGIVAVCCSRRLAREIVSGIVGVPVTELTDEDLLDGMSELANMICGGMKTQIGIASSRVALSPSSAILGGDYVAQWKTSGETVVMAFHVDTGKGQGGGEQEDLLEVHASF